MSGHSHWHSIKYKKTAADVKRSKFFSKMSREIAVAAKDGGGDPNFNPKLRIAIDRARAFNMPAGNIEKAIKKGTGEIKGATLEEIIFEAYGPGGIAIIIEGITDNKNRALGEIKQVLSQHGGKLVGEGSVKWLFEKKGCITVDQSLLQNEDFKNEEKLEMAVIESGAEDIYWHENILDVYTKPEELEKVKKHLEEKGIRIESASLDWVAKKMIKIDEVNKAACQKLFEELDENETTQEIYSNLETQ